MTDEVKYTNNGRWVTGRKAYKCWGCKRAIAAGERHWNDYNCADDMFHPDRYCAECATKPEELPDYNTWPRTTSLSALASPEVQP